MTSSNSSTNPQDQSRENLFSEQGRLNTYKSWPHSAALAPGPLAKAGFYYLGQGDRVRCAFCTGTLKNWQHGDDPAVEHRKHFRNCRFIKGEDVGNVPLQQQQQRPSGAEAAHPSSAHTEHTVKTAQGGQHQGSEAGSGSAAAVMLNPRNPDFQTVSSRELTFVGWAPDAVVRPQALVDAGFFFTGDGDGVRCFCCDGALRSWEPGDDPWVEHAHWFPRCPYLLQRKGATFVNEVQARFAAVARFPPASGTVEGSSSSSSFEDTVMSSEVARQALDMGFDPEAVLNTLSQHLLSSGGQLPPLDLLIGMLVGENTTGEVRTGERTASPPPPVREESSSGLSPVLAGSQLRQEEGGGGGGGGGSGGRVSGGGGSDRTLCKICMDREVAVTFLPCGHLVCCSQCAQYVKQCPVCRQTVKASIRTYLC
ncbi:baculoviral IAP repeat-containing protein 7-like [Babylonia areolata]|uniref:baculoviral IAP repeat-containing protein 7-like n=1 Tax=Babylonia areolata TaxID=304850 RepID=UPI003FCF665B